MTNPIESERSAWSTFKSWHRTEDFWLDIYKRTLGYLILALIAFLFAASTGFIKKDPAIDIASILDMLIPTAILIGAIRYNLAKRWERICGVLLAALLYGWFIFLWIGALQNAHHH